MTDDLVKRLRNLGINLADRAADRIEADAATIARLVEALQKIAEWPDYRLPKPCDIARAAIAAAKENK